nr:unnamed protein product [Digitaria exilis]
MDYPHVPVAAAPSHVPVAAEAAACRAGQHQAPRPYYAAAAWAWIARPLFRLRSFGERFEIGSPAWCVPVRARAAAAEWRRRARLRTSRSRRRRRPCRHRGARSEVDWGSGAGI